jgi:hypothetical protein
MAVGYRPTASLGVAALRHCQFVLTSPKPPKIAIVRLVKACRLYILMSSYAALLAV